MPRLLEALHASNPASPEETIECLLVRASDPEFYKAAQRCCSEPERGRLKGVVSLTPNVLNREAPIPFGFLVALRLIQCFECDILGSFPYHRE